jgi:hypothetical protein
MVIVRTPLPRGSDGGLVAGVPDLLRRHRPPEMVSLHTASGIYYPRRAMNLAFNEWFIDGELGPKGPVRS